MAAVLLAAVFLSALVASYVAPISLPAAATWNGITMGESTGPAPLITVILCTYHRDDLALRALRSVLAQDFHDYEIVVVDQDMEGRLEARIAESFGPRANLRHLRISTRGLSHARNVGAEEARGRILAFLDDDAEAMDGWLAGYADAFLGKPAPVMVGGRILPVWQAPRPGWYPSSRLYVLGLYDLGEAPVPFPENELPIGANFAILRDSLLRLGGFSTELGFHADRPSSALGGEDSLIGARVRQEGGLILYHPRAAVTHLIRADKLGVRYFVKRHFVEGMTQIMILDGVKPLDAAFLKSARRWHALTLSRVPIEWLLGGTGGASALGEALASAALSSGIIYQCTKLLRRRRNLNVAAA